MSKKFLVFKVKYPNDLKFAMMAKVSSKVRVAHNPEQNLSNSDFCFNKGLEPRNTNKGTSTCY